MIYFYFFLIIFLLFSALILFYPFSLSFTGSKKFFFISFDLLFVDFFIEKEESKIKKIINVMGIYKHELKSENVAFYNPDYNRIYYVAGFLVKHIKSIFKIVNIERLGIDLCAGIDDRYMLSQFLSFSIIVNNFLPDGLYINFVPDFEKQNFVFYGQGKISVKLINILLFFVVLIIHPATYLGLWELYRYKSDKQ